MLHQPFFYADLNIVVLKIYCVTWRTAKATYNVTFLCGNMLNIFIDSKPCKIVTQRDLECYKEFNSSARSRL